MIGQKRLINFAENPNDEEIHRIHKMSFAFFNGKSLIYLLTDRNEIFQLEMKIENDVVNFDQRSVENFLSKSISSIGICRHKPWLVLLDENHRIRIVDYQDFPREILNQQVSGVAEVLSGNFKQKKKTKNEGERSRSMTTQAEQFTFMIW